MQSEDGKNPPENSSSPPVFDPMLTDTVEMDAMQVVPAEQVRPDLPQPTQLNLAHGEAVWISVPSPHKQTENEDAVDAFLIGKNRALLIVADGLGGHRGGKTASQSVLRGMRKKLKRTDDEVKPNEIVISGGLKVPVGPPSNLNDADYRSLILDQIETANRRLLDKRTGAATTLAVVEAVGNRVRTYHVGDSPILVIGQKGQIKHETISHSPVGYAVEAGLLSENEAIHHEHRHLVSNVVGSKDMTVELGTWVTLAIRDTVLLASDGLFDNLLTVEIVDRIRSGNLVSSVAELAALALDRMCLPQPDLPSKPDDLTILAYRRTSQKRNSG